MPPSSAAVHKTKTADGLITVRFKFVVPVCDFPHRKPSSCFELEDLLGSLETLAPSEWDRGRLKLLKVAFWGCYEVAVFGWFFFLFCFVSNRSTEISQEKIQVWSFVLSLRLSPYLSRKGEFHCLWQMRQVGFYILRDKDLVEHCDLWSLEKNSSRKMCWVHKQRSWREGNNRVKQQETACAKSVRTLEWGWHGFGTELGTNCWWRIHSSQRNKQVARKLWKKKIKIFLHFNTPLLSVITGETHPRPGQAPAENPSQWHCLVSSSSAKPQQKQNLIFSF